MEGHPAEHPAKAHAVQVAYPKNLHPLEAHLVNLACE